MIIMIILMSFCLDVTEALHALLPSRMEISKDEHPFHAKCFDKLPSSDQCWRIILSSRVLSEPENVVEIINFETFILHFQLLGA